VYGPVRTVVWQGSAGDRRPYADQTAFAEIGTQRLPLPSALPPSGLSGPFVVRRGFITSYANNATAQGSAAPSELGRASASKVSPYADATHAQARLALRVAEGLREFREYRREVAMNNMAKLPFELSVAISRSRLKPHRGTGVVES
jgi:hypothetical protein